MAQPSKTAPVIKLQLRGLFTNPSTFGGNVPPGALKVADNVVMDRPSVVATRRGRDNTFSTITGTTLSMFQYGQVKLAWTDQNKLYCDTLTNGVFNAYTGTYLRPSSTTPGSRVHGLEQNKNFYFNTENGLYRLDSPTGTPRLAGAPPGLQGTGVTTGVTGFLPNNTNIAYRVVFGYKDANQTLVLGAPSSRIIVSNSSGTSADVNVTFQVPKEIQAAPTDWIYQLYRGHATASLSDEPDDEMALCFEDVATGTPTITVLDLTPDTELGAALYTNAGVEGIVQSNYRPPWCADMALFQSTAFYANTRDLQTVVLTLLASGALAGPDALIPGDNINFTANELSGPSFTLTADTTNNAALGKFAVSNTGNPGVDLYQTAYNICLVANGYSGNTFLTAYYISSNDDRPGQMQFTRITPIDSTFTITSSRTTCWVETVAAVAPSLNSSNTERANRVYYSKNSQVESVPLVNYIELGSANQRIDRILTLQNGLIVMKQDGVFRISAGGSGTWQQQLLDGTARILAPNTAVVGNNLVWFLSDQGVVAASETDVQIQSFVLDNNMNVNSSYNLFPNLQETAWGIAYQSDRKYELWLPQTAADTQATHQYIYNYQTQNWVRWLFKGTCAMVFNVDSKMYFGSQSGSAPGDNQSYIYQERKTMTTADMVDDQYSATSLTTGTAISTIHITNPVMPAGVSILPGWTITQVTTGSLARVVSTLVGANTIVTLDRTQNWDATAVIIWVPVAESVTFIQIDCDNPGFNKQFPETIYMFTQQDFTQLTVNISSDTTNTTITDYLVPLQTGGWGIDPWGTTPWGGSTPLQGKIRRYNAQNIQRAGWLYINISNAEAFTTFGLSGVELPYNVTSTRQF